MLTIWTAAITYLDGLAAGGRLHKPGHTLRRQSMCSLAHIQWVVGATFVAEAGDYRLLPAVECKQAKLQKICGAVP